MTDNQQSSSAPRPTWDRQRWEETVSGNWRKVPVTIVFRRRNPASREDTLDLEPPYKVNTDAYHARRRSQIYDIVLYFLRRHRGIRTEGYKSMPARIRYTDLNGVWKTMPIRESHEAGLDLPEHDFWGKETFMKLVDGWKEGMPDPKLPTLLQIHVVFDEV